MLGTEGTTPGVEWRKELSLSVEEWSSPKSHKARADADGPKSTYDKRQESVSSGFKSVNVLSKIKQRLNKV